MKFNSLIEIKAGEIYHWVVKGLLKGLHKGTKTVKVMDIYDRSAEATTPLARVESLETGEIFLSDVGHLQQDPKFLKKKYKALLKYWQRTGVKPSAIYELADHFQESLKMSKRHVKQLSKDRSNYFRNNIQSKYVNVPDPKPKFRNLVKAICSNGIVSSYHVANIKGLEKNEDPIQTLVDEIDDDPFFIEENDDFDFKL